MQERVGMVITLPVELRKEDNIYIAGCIALDVFSQGVSEDEAMENIQEALDLFIDTCIDMGTLEQVLTDSGFTREATQHEIKKSSGPLIDISIPLISHGRHSGIHQAC